MVQDGAHTRLVCTVLLVGLTERRLSGAGATAGASREVERLRALAATIVTAAGGRTEPVAGDDVFAVFEDAAAAVDAALRIVRTVAHGVIGGHHGALFRRSGALFGDAASIAARLQRLARPGTVCVSEDVHRQVAATLTDPVEDLGPQRLEGMPVAVRVYRIAPRGTEGHLGRRHAFRLVGGVALAAVVTGAASWYVSRRHTFLRSGSLAREAAQPVAGSEDTPRIALGVMLFKPLRDDPATAWMGEMLRDGLNTQLSGLSSVKVYSKEFIDFLITREGLSEYEAARRLGIGKMLSGSFGVFEGALRIETHIVDVASGVLDASLTTLGLERDVLDLQGQLGLDVVARLDLPITPEERQALLARRATDVDALKALLEAEGKRSREPAAPDPEPGSRVQRWLARLAPRPAPAHAEDPPANDILGLLERYRRATEARDVAALAALHVEYPAEQRAAQQRYFDNVRGDLRVAIEDVDVVVVGDEAVASYTRTDDFTDARSGRPMHVTVRPTKVLRRRDGVWRLTSGQ